MAAASPAPGGYPSQVPDHFHQAAAQNPYATVSVNSVPDNTANEEANRLTNALKARKRTKTGCLTCRKRRIKCGEERPTCRNCIKSKRDCEGYIPRVVLKDNAAAAGLPPQSPYFPHGYTNADSALLYGDPSGVSLEGASYQAIAPRPAPTANGVWPQPTFQMTEGYMPMHPQRTAPLPPQASPFNAHFALDAFGNPVRANPGQYANIHGAAPMPPHAPASVPIPRQTDAPRSSMTWPYSPASTISSVNHPPITPARDQFTSVDHSSTSIPMPVPYEQDPSHTSAPNGQTPSSVGQEAVFGVRSHLHPIPDASQELITEMVQAINQSQQTPAPALSHQPEPEDDWFDVESDEEGSTLESGVPQANLGLIIARNAQQSQTDFRSMTNFLDDSNVLATYNPSYAASPLKDPHTARVFCHFITATGPTLHVSERHPSNPAVIFSGRPVPKSRQALWSYTLPMLALRHQGLLQSMLAMSSLHIAKLQNTSPTPSLRHYHYALRRVSKALGDKKKRRDPATLAATLLLGYYEVTTAEHNKWNSHLSGARELILGIPFTKLAKKVSQYRHRKAEEEMTALAQNGQPALQAQHKPPEIPVFGDGQLDEDLISQIMGFDIRHAPSGKILDGKEQSPEREETPTSHHVEEYETQLDLFWWYAKQDCYQSILSGNRLLLSYDRWSLCPPRAVMGRIDAVYGTMDHLLLLLSRLADYAGKDISRKKRAFIAAEKEAKAARNSPPTSTQGSPGQPPPMYGMIPDPGPVRVPSGFNQQQHDDMYTAPPRSENQPLDVALNEALAEWASIAQAFDTFHQALGPSYEPLSPDHMTPLSTPFGPAIYFRSYGIASVLQLYHTGRIILTRTHPHMPPAAMVAALVARQKTEPHANAIGRICAGMQPVSNTAPLNPHHGAALMECCMGLFHASIQFTDPAQRGWTITKLRDVARLTGWQTSSLVAAGCERAWIHYAGVGKGPPYERTMNKVATDDRVAGRSRDPEHLATKPKDNNDRRFVKVNAGTRVYWAMGILSVEEDMKELNVGE